MDAFTHRVYLSRVRDFVENVPFPATRDEILSYARRRNTSSDIFNDLTHLKPVRFNSVDEVIAAVDALRAASASR
jgi:hypothetical protein